MRNDFFNDPQGSSPSYNPTTWIHDPNRQGQQINIDTNNPLTISSIPFIPTADSSSCTGNILSRGNETGVDGTLVLHDEVPGSGSTDDTWNPKINVTEPYETSDFTIKFDEIKTFNGDVGDNPIPIVDGQEVDHVRIFRKGSVIEYIRNGVEIPLDGYDDDPTDDDGEYSLGEFLAFKGYAVEIGTSGEYRLVDDTDDLSTNPFPDPDAHDGLIKLEDKERIVAIEIGQVEVGATFGDGSYNPGFDLQDNVVLMSVDKFDPNHSSTPPSH